MRLKGISFVSKFANQHPTTRVDPQPKWVKSQRKNHFSSHLIHSIKNHHGYPPISCGLGKVFKLYEEAHAACGKSAVCAHAGA